MLEIRDGYIIIPSRAFQNQYKGQGRGRRGLLMVKPVPDCHPDREYYAKGMCRNCYARQNIAGRPRLRRKKQYRRASLLSKYKLTESGFEALLIGQNNRCAACRELFNEVNKPVVDHDHKCCPGTRSCGKCVRGLLCQQCNRFVGICEKVLRNEAFRTYLREKCGLDV